MQPVFLGSHPAIDFLNTSLAPEGEWLETIGDGAAYLDWLVAASLLDQAVASRLMRRFGVKAMDKAAAEAREVRRWAKDWLLRWRVQPQAVYAAESAALNVLLTRASFTRELSSADEQLTLVEKPRVDSAQALIALVALQIGALVTSENPALIKECAGHSCTLWFLDQTKAHRRLFCSAAACGNRAKVAAFRERQRG